MEIHLKKQSLSGSFTTSGKARQLKSFCNLTHLVAVVTYYGLVWLFMIELLKI